MTRPSTPWIAFSKPAPRAEMRLFCFAHAGGGASAFRSWQEAFPETVHVCPVQLPGRENRLNEPGYTRLEPLVAALLDALEPSMDIPFAFFGHSLGGLVAFELARALKRNGRRLPTTLILSGCKAPERIEREEPVHLLSPEDFIAHIQKLSGTPKEVLDHPELMALLAPTLRRDFEIVGTYAYRASEPLDCPIVAWGGETDPKADADDLAAWRGHTRSAFEMRVFPGDHFYIYSRRDLTLPALAAELEKAKGGA